MTTPQPVATANFGSNQMTDYILANLFYSKFAESMKDNAKITPSCLLKLFMLMCFNETKPYFIPALVDIIKKLPKFISIRWIWQLLKIFHKRNSETLPQTIDHHIYKNINLCVDSVFLQMFWVYLENLKRAGNADYYKKLSKIDVKNTKEVLFTYEITNINFGFKNLKIRVDSNMGIAINNYNQNYVKFSLSGNEKKSFYDFLPAKLANICREIYKISGGNIENHFYPAEKFPNILTEYEICDLLHKNYPTLNKTILLKEVLVFSALLVKSGCASLPQTKEIMHCLDNTKTYTTSKSNTSAINTYITGELRDDFYTEARKWYQEASTRDKAASNETELKLTIYDKNDFDIDLISDAFIKTIYDQHTEKNNAIKIYTIHLKTTHKTSEKPNPAYAEWEERRKLLEKENSSVMKDLGMLTIPPKTITETTSEKNIACRQLNTVTKSMETLYLQQRDKTKLLSCLRQFRDKKEIFVEFGIPNKLNIMMYGAPGTGKSTTIQAIATYLAKDIYYLDLQNVKTNADLQMLLDYTNNNVPGGAIIVMEDVDAMSNIFHKRADVRTRTTAELIADETEKLSLEYLLNLLQGTLTIDGSIFLMTTNHINFLDSALIRPGRFDLLLELKPANHYQINCIYEKMMARKLSPEILSRIPEYKHTPAEIIYHLKNYLFENVSDAEIWADFVK